MFDISLTDNGTNCRPDEQSLDNQMSPFTFPLLIEFCIMASMMLLTIWEKTGIGYQPIYDVHVSEISRASSVNDLTSSQELTTMSSTSSFNEILEDMTGLYSSAPNTNNQSPPHGKFYNTNHGFIMGWLVVMATVVIAILCLYDAYTDNAYVQMSDSIVYSTNLALSVLILIFIPITMYKMSPLTFKDEEIKAIRSKRDEKESGRHKSITQGMDKDLLAYTFYALMLFKIMCMIYGLVNKDYLVVADCIVSIIMAYAQATFINWYAFKKRTTTQQQRINKPGRQELEFLRLCNLSLWLVNTFLLRNPLSKEKYEQTFGEVAWAIISNITQPLTILFYFHSVICLAEVVVHSYSTKYIGVIRPHKRKATYINFITDKL